MRLIVTYDIENDRRRAKTADTLLDAGLRRVQKSVFEGDVSPEEFTKLKSGLGRLIARRDNIRYYQLCRKCLTRTETTGRAAPGGAPEETILI